MTPKDKMAELSFELDVRFGKIIWLATTLTDVPSDDFLQWLEDSDNVEELLGVPFPDVSGRKNILRNYEKFAHKLARKSKFGFLIKMETPVRDNISSWGVTTWRWFYFDSWDVAAITQCAQNFVEDIIAQGKK